MTSVDLITDKDRPNRAIYSRTRKMNQQRILILALLALLLVGVMMIAAGSGAVEIQPRQVLAIVLDRFGISSSIDFEARQKTVLMGIRLPRVVLGALVGAMLAASGAALQGLFRSPLADPSLLGISSGSALTVTIALALGVSRTGSSAFVIPVVAFIGAVLTTGLIYRLATAGGRTNTATMLLAGVAINALAGAGVGFLTFISGGATGGAADAAFWTLGSLTRATWELVTAIMPFALLTLITLPFLARPLNVLLLGESEAGHLGINVQRIRQQVIILAALAVGAGVAAAGVLGFVALLVPYVLRRVIGSDFRYLLPGSMLLGGALVVIADLIARTIAMPVEIPIGVLTTLAGGPVFLWLLLKDRSRGVMI